VTAPKVSDPATSKAARTRQRIVEAAAHELARYGYGGTSLRQVAAAAQLQLGSLYFHFASKDDLVAETLREGVEFALTRVTDALAGLPSDASQAARLRTAITAHLAALHASHDRAASVVRMAGTLPPDLRQEQAAHERRYGQVWLNVLSEAQRDGAIDQELDVRVLRDILLGAMNSTLNTTPPADPDRNDRVVDTLLYLLLDGRTEGHGRVPADG
jgi:TetR/AcrR family transcriptional regulator, cholesterol catabolism regulator